MPINVTLEKAARIFTPLQQISLVAYLEFPIITTLYQESEGVSAGFIILQRNLADRSSGK
jgi:hypothetical protein